MARIILKNIWITSLAFEINSEFESFRAEEASKAATITTTYSLGEDGKGAEVRVGFSIKRPEEIAQLKVVPFFLQVELIGKFEIRDKRSKQKFKKFIEAEAANLLIPYLDELVRMITSFTPFPIGRRLSMEI